MKVGDLVKITEPKHEAAGKLGLLLEVETRMIASVRDDKGIRAVNCSGILVGDQEVYVLPDCLEIVNES